MRDLAAGKMEVANGLVQFVPPQGGVVLTIGNFDGVHRGHAELVSVARAAARRLEAGVAAMTFHPHPLAVLGPERPPAMLTTLAEKLLLLERLGVDHGIVLRSTPELLAQRADDFLAGLVTHCHPRALVEGSEFNFGRGREGSIDTLEQHAAQWGYEVHEVPEVHCEELSSRPAISSTSIRQALRDGRVEAANIMLGRPYRMVGVIGHGDGRGAKLGYPTANLECIRHLLPQEAVYAAVAQLEDGTLHPAAVNIGAQPTFEQELPRVEAHVLNFKGDLRGGRMGLHFLARLREQEKFDSSQRLIEQIGQDVSATRKVAEELGAGVTPISM